MLRDSETRLRPFLSQLAWLAALAAVIADKAAPASLDTWTASAH